MKLVVLPLNAYHKQGDHNTPALKLSREMLSKRGELPRHYSNMIIFICPDERLLIDLEQTTRQFLAWKSVDADWETLDLKVSERRQAEDFKKQTNRILDKKTLETYCWTFVPTQDDTMNSDWEIIKTSGTEEYPIKISKKLNESELLVSKWSPAILKMELDKWLWNETNHIPIKTLWENLCTYTYLTRLKNSDVLISTIQNGVASKDFFGYANGIDENGKYLGLKYNVPDCEIYLDSSSILVKPEIAKQQIEHEELKNDNSNESEIQPNIPATSNEPSPEIKRRFYGNVPLDWTTISPKTGEIASEIIEHLKSLNNSNVEITLEITGIIPNGIPDDVVRTISENCKTLKFSTYEFTEE